ncbi:jmjC domain-containing protein 8 isoform X4 [Lepidochelys kempii]|uniref:jmjC domain-containing protein 8 isoform X4 n=1 Tax=Lepidochelys kempii TaxID=8472 RepID=UPI003C7001AB
MQNAMLTHERWSGKPPLLKEPGSCLSQCQYLATLSTLIFTAFCLSPDSWKIIYYLEADEQVFGSDGRRPLHGGEERCFPDLLPVHRPICLFQACCYPGNHGQLGIPGALHKEQAAGRVRGPPVDVPFQEYVEHLLEPQDLASLGSDTLYFFGDNNFTEWGSLFQKYMPPPFRIPGTSRAYSFGIAGSGSGVPFHWHGPGYSEVIFGRKRWFLYPPEKTPEFHPNKTTLSWLLDTYPFLPPEDRPVECTIHPGEVLYFPDRWWHATLNLDTSVFISTFLG